jgi:two-component sensor histidine kinase
LEDALASGSPYADELRMHTVRNEDRWFVTRGQVMADEQKVIGVARDVTDRRRREDTLRAAIVSRDLLMREADHRIKNSLQLVVALLRLQRNQVADAQAKAALDAAMARVNAVAEAHMALQSSPDLRSLNVDEMLSGLCERIGMLNPAVTVRCDSSTGLCLDAEQAVPLGLIASELLTNALRHAFPDQSSGEVTLTARTDADTFKMIIADNGVGMITADNGVGMITAGDGVGMPAPPRPGLGTTVVTALTRQLAATLLTQSRPQLGTTMTLSLKLPTQAGHRLREAAEHP